MRSAISIVLTLWLGMVPALTVEVFAQSAQSPRIAQRQDAVGVPRSLQRCLRALDGSCTKQAVVESVRLRALVFSTLRVSYYGTPAGVVPGTVAVERFFRDDPVLFGLPTVVYGPGPCCILRTR